MIRHDPVLPPEFIYPIDDWRWVERRYAPEFMATSETTFATANGYLGMRGAFLLGVDLVKSVLMLEAAYDDAAGVTAEFNRNILRVVNDALDGDFQPEAYRHVAFYDADKARIEMHLAPDGKQRVRLEKLDLTIDVGVDETIWTEISCKFTHPSASAMLNEAGLKLQGWYTDDQERFALALASPA